MRSNNAVFKCCTCKTLNRSTVVNGMHVAVAVIKFRVFCSVCVILGIYIPESKKRILFIDILRIRSIQRSVLIAFIFRIGYTCKLKSVDFCINLCDFIKCLVCIAGLPVSCVVADDILYLSYKILVCKDCIFHSTDRDIIHQHTAR